MADITARIIWYRLGEVADSARAYLLDEDVDVLDVLFAFWVLVAMAVLLIVYGVEWLGRRSRVFKSAPGSEERWQHLKRQHSFFRDPEEHRQVEEGHHQSAAATAVTSAVDGGVGSAPIRAQPVTSAAAAPKSDRVDGSEDSCHWLNRLMTWMFLNYSKPPVWLQDWLTTLNDELRTRARGQKVGGYF